ncbi:MAG: calcium-binding protein [Methylovulum sp.]|nr:calcium-binding protein [Methylovulum sp.]
MAILKGDKNNNTLTGGTDKDALFGFAGTDTLNGNGGDDLLNGGEGADSLVGGVGNDTYFVDNIKDKVIELKAEGIDTVKSSISWRLSGNIENLTLTGSAMTGIGNTLANTIKGNSAANVLDGKLGVDTLVGGLGDDLYEVTAGDNTIEWANAGTDKVASPISWLLANHIENLFLYGTANINGTGNHLDNIIQGNTGNNVLDGKGGADMLFGYAGDDTLVVKKFNGFDSASVAKDQVYGGEGNDTLVLTGAGNKIDLQRDKVYGLEVIDLTGSGINSLHHVAANDVADLSATDVLTIKGNAGDTVKLSNDGGIWIDNGIVNGDHLFSSGTTKLVVDEAVTVIAPETLPSYTVSDAGTAANVGSFFTSEAQKVVIDFGGKNYRDLSFTSIDLTGFGLEDTLVITQHDGAINKGSASYGSQRSNYIIETSVTVSYSNLITDRVSWHLGSSKAAMYSKDMHYTGNNHGTGSSSSFSFPVPTSGTIQIIGLPTGLADAQFVFI